MRPLRVFPDTGPVGRALWPALALLSACITDPGEFLTVELEISDLVVMPSHPIDVAVRVSNFGGREAKIEVACFPQRFWVTDGIGVRVGPEGLTTCSASAPSPPPVTALAPGTTLTFATQWAGEGFAGDTLPFAIYGLEGWATPEGRDPIYTGAVAVRFQADTLPTDTLPPTP